jgi:hypothetical protein
MDVINGLAFALGIALIFASIGVLCARWVWRILRTYYVVDLNDRARARYGERHYPSRFRDRS